jgi:hypothetical protein
MLATSIQHDKQSFSYFSGNRTGYDFSCLEVIAVINPKIEKLSKLSQPAEPAISAV